eukprot:GSMAST32.ASY1.ANO1.686.1 assembled CDS
MASVGMWTTAGTVNLDAMHVGGDDELRRGERYDGGVERAISGCSSEVPIECRASPYDFNGGTCLAIAGADFCVVGADTRLSSGYNIITRNGSVAHQLTSKCVMAQYIDNHGREMSTPSIAQLLSTNLYGRRFFPYYAFNVVGGIDSDGKGAVYTYDAIGSFERVKYASQGAGQKLIIPILDNVVGNKNRADAPCEYTKEQAVELVKDVFITAGERDIFTGDKVEIFVITSKGVEKIVFDLKAD